MNVPIIKIYESLYKTHEYFLDDARFFGDRDRWEIQSFNSLKDSHFKTDYQFQNPDDDEFVRDIKDTVVSIIKR